MKGAILVGNKESLTLSLLMRKARFGRNPVKQIDIPVLVVAYGSRIQNPGTLFRILSGDLMEKFQKKF